MTVVVGDASDDLPLIMTVSDQEEDAATSDGDGSSEDDFTLADVSTGALRMQMMNTHCRSECVQQAQVAD